MAAPHFPYSSLAGDQVLLKVAGISQKGHPASLVPCPLKLSLILLAQHLLDAQHLLAEPLGSESGPEQPWSPTVQSLFSIDQLDSEDGSQKETQSGCTEKRNKDTATPQGASLRFKERARGLSN